MPTLVHASEQIDFDKPGKHHYQVAFHLDGAWGYSLVPLTVVNGRRGKNTTGVICFGGTHGNEYEGQIAVKNLCTDLDPDAMSGRVVLLPQLSESACVANSRDVAARWRQHEPRLSRAGARQHLVPYRALREDAHLSTGPRCDRYSLRRQGRSFPHLRFLPSDPGSRATSRNRARGSTL